MMIRTLIYSFTLFFLFINYVFAINLTEIEEPLKEELIANKYVSSGLTYEEIFIKFDARGKKIISELEEKSFKVRVLDANNKTHRFKAVIETEEKSSEISGFYDECLNIPVLKNEVKIKSLITENDLVFQRFLSSKIQYNTYLNKEDIVGKISIRNIRANIPIKANDVMEPELVTKNDIITIIYENNSITIKTSAIALEGGKLNDIIKLKNVKSGNVIHGKIIGHKLAKVS